MEVVNKEALPGGELFWNLLYCVYIPTKFSLL